MAIIAGHGGPTVGPVWHYFYRKGSRHPVQVQETNCDNLVQSIHEIPLPSSHRHRAALLSRYGAERRKHDATRDALRLSPFWTWVFKADLYVLFRIDKSRGSQVLIEMLGREFEGTIGCDYFSAYRKQMKDFNVLLQFCIAHLIRGTNFLTKLPDAPDPGL